MQYYVYSENSNAGMFSPERAEHEYFTIDINSSVVINEFLADNKSIVTDQNNQYDDWIELYNNTNQPVDLSGYFLSDNVADILKWKFPNGTIINANDFLIIWADEDGSQSGLHANFKLSAYGESIILSNPQSNIIDQITFSNQTSDISFGRYPNGTGKFSFMTPSFNKLNNQHIITSAAIDDQLPKIFKFYQNYPNPFNPSTTISFSMPSLQNVSIKIFNILGGEVATLINETKAPGNYQLEFDGSRLSSGVYFYTLQSGSFIQTKKFVLMK